VEADDSYWRRPPNEGNAAPSGNAVPIHTGGPVPTYHGPPPTTPPPAGWRPAHIVEPPPPRHLPAQDHARIDDEEARARTLTRGVGLVVAAVLVIVLCVLCGRTLSTGPLQSVPDHVRTAVPGLEHVVTGRAADGEHRDGEDNGQ
jgi:hypothetical protein